MFINRAEINEGLAQVLAVGVGTPVTPEWGVLAGLAYEPVSSAMAVIATAPVATDPYAGGMRYTNDNRLYVWPVSTLGVPTTVFWNQGLPFVPDGRLVVSSAARTNWVAGWPVDASGWVCMTLSGPPPPPAPGAFTFAPNVLPENVQIFWTASAGATSYNIFRDSVQIATVLAPLTDYTDSTAPLGVALSYTMFAINTGGSTASTSNPQVVTRVTVPSQPAAPSAFAGSGNATISWVPPADGGSVITLYVIQPFIGAVGQATQQTSSPSPYLFTGLTNGLTYTFKISAVNAVGQGPYSPNSNAVTPAAVGPTVPVAPTIGTATSTNPGNANLTWVTNGDGGAPIIDFRITSTPDGIVWVRSVSPSFLAGLTNGVAYTFKVEARNSVGYSLPSAASNSVTPPYANLAPGAPTIGTATAGAPGTGQATVTFTAPAYNGGPPVTGYTVTSSPGGITNTGAASPLVVGGLSGGTPYTFTVTATNSVGTGLASAASNSVTLVTVPAAPVIGTATSPASGQLSITFIPPNNGGSAITGYTATTTPGGFTATGAASPILFTGLAANTYTVKVKATNAVGTGPESAASNSVVVAGAGAVPIFNSPLITTLVPTVAGGSNTPTFLRATTAYVTDFEGILRLGVINEARFQGARRVQNRMLTNSENLTIGQGNVLNATITTTTVAFTVVDNSYYYKKTPNSQPLLSTMVGRITVACSVSRVVCIRFANSAGGGGTIQFVNATVDSTPKTFSFQITNPNSGGLSCEIGLDLRAVAGATNTGTTGVFTLSNFQIEDSSGASNQAANEYASVGILSAPFHGAGVDGVKYFTTTNGNSVAGNVLTEAAGTPISAATLLGYVAEQQRTNYCLQSQLFDDASWVKATITVALNSSTAPDGTTTADTLTASAGNGTALQTVTSASAAYTFSVYLRRLTGTGVVQITLDGFSTSQTCVLTTAWQRFERTQTLANPNVGIRIVTSGDAVYAWGAQLEGGSVASPYITTLAAQVTQSGDVLAYALPNNFFPATGSYYYEATLPSAIEATDRTTIRLVDTSRDGGTIDNLSVRNHAVLDSAGARLSSANQSLVAYGTPNKIAAGWSGATASIVANNTIVGTGAFTAWAGTGNVNIGTSNGGTVGGVRGLMRNVKFYNVRLTDADLRALTT